MRVHVTCKGKKTTVSVDDVLIDYLGASLVAKYPKFHKNAKFQLEQALDMIRRYAEVCAEEPSEDTLSSRVQAAIIRGIAAPGLADTIHVRGPRYKKAPPAPVPKEWTDEFASTHLKASAPANH